MVRLDYDYTDEARLTDGCRAGLLEQEPQVDGSKTVHERARRLVWIDTYRVHVTRPLTSDMGDTAPRIELLILDFAGVCTPSASELRTIDAHGPIPIRSGVSNVVTTAQEQGVTVVILSNEISTDWVLSEDLFRQVDHVVSCADNKIWKPDRRAFQRCLLLVGCDAEQTLVVDDQVDNVTVAESLGMRTVHFDNTRVAASWSHVLGALS